MRIKLALLLFCLSMLPLYGLTQWGAVEAGWFSSGFEGINDTLEAISRDLGGAGFKGFSEPQFGIGGSGGLGFGVFSAGAWVTGMLKQAKEESLTASMGYAAGGLEMGLRWKPFRWLGLDLTLDLCASCFELEAYERNASQDPYRQVIRGGELSVGPGLGLNLGIPLDDARVASLSLKGGYLFPFYTAYNDLEGSIQPVDFGFSGLYIRAGLSFSRKLAEPRVPETEFESDTVGARAKQ